MPIGVVVRYGGHKATFLADMILVEGAWVIHASQPITDQSLNRNEHEYDLADAQVWDFPSPGFWKPRHAVLVVPKNQVEWLQPNNLPLGVELPKKKAKKK